MDRKLKSALVAIIAVIALAVGTAVPTRAAALTSVVAAQSQAPYHDTRFPMREVYPCTGAAHSGVAKMGAGPAFNCAKASVASGKITPYANNQSGNCQNGITYLQGFTNVPGYSSGTVVNQFYSGTSTEESRYAQSPDYTQSGGNWQNFGINPNLQYMVEYFWCPAKNSSQYPSGINYAYGQIAYTSGCGNIYVQNSVTMFTSHNAQYVSDGEDTPYYGICSGNFVWDYSNIGSGQYAWAAETSSYYLWPCSNPCVVNGWVHTPAFH